MGLYDDEEPRGGRSTGAYLTVAFVCYTHVIRIDPEPVSSFIAPPVTIQSCEAAPEAPHTAPAPGKLPQAISASIVGPTTDHVNARAFVCLCCLVKLSSRSALNQHCCLGSELRTFSSTLDSRPPQRHALQNGCLRGLERSSDQRRLIRAVQHWWTQTTPEAPTTRPTVRTAHELCWLWEHSSALLLQCSRL